MKKWVLLFLLISTHVVLWSQPSEINTASYSDSVRATLCGITIDSIKVQSLRECARLTLSNNDLVLIYFDMTIRESNNISSVFSSRQDTFSNAMTEYLDRMQIVDNNPTTIIFENIVAKDKVNRRFYVSPFKVKVFQ